MIQRVPASLSQQAGHAVALINAGQMKQAERILKDILNSDPRHFDGLQALAFKRNLEGRHGEAIRLLETALKREPNSAPGNLNYGQALLKAGRHADAALAFTRAVAIDPKNGHAHDLLGQALLGAGKIVEAAASFEQAVALDPANALAMSSAIETKRKICDWTGIEDLERRVVVSARAGRAAEPLLMLHVIDEPQLHRRVSEAYWREMVLGGTRQ